MSELHPNSRKVTIFRSASNLSRVQGPQAELYLSDGNVSVGSYFTNRNSQKIASGLTFEEEDILLPKIIDYQPSDREFRKQITEYYRNIDTKIPHGTGRELEIGLSRDNALPISYDLKNPDKSNMPINLDDYIRYRHAVGHPFMASNKEEADGNSTKQYYVFDPENLKAKGSKRATERDAAINIYLNVKNDAGKVDMLLTLLNKDPREFTGKTAAQDKVDTLYEKAQTESASVIEVYKDGYFEEKYNIQSMINTGVIKVAGGKYYDAETDKLIGNNLEETVLWFKDEDNSQSVIILKALLQEAIKKPITKGTTRTKPLAGRQLGSHIAR